MLTSVKTIKLSGMKAVPITVECDIQKGIGIHLIGLSDAAVKESLIRTVTALQSQGYHIPGKRIIINVAPADLVKTGSGYDLPIALTVIAASEQTALPELDRWLVVGELGLDSRVRYVEGCLQAMLQAKESGLKGCIVPKDALEELRPFAESLNVYAVETLNEAIDIIKGISEKPTVWDTPVKEDMPVKPYDESDWKQIQCNQGALRAIKIAAAGGHNILLIGAPGSQKSSLAKALHALLPPMMAQESTETALVYSASGRRIMDGRMRPFRAPHYSCSLSAMLGGGSGDAMHPGEVSLANNGVLYLDEMNLAPKSMLEALRTPLENKKIVISRLKSKTEYPAKFILAGAVDPCPCGYYGEGDRCTCTPRQRQEWLSRLSGPVYDRITVQAYTHVPKLAEIVNLKSYESLDKARENVLKARKLQQERFAGKDYQTNEDMPVIALETYCKHDDVCRDLMEKLIDRLGLSARAYTRILRIARTIADLEGTENIRPEHIAEAASYRFLDRMDIVYGKKEFEPEKEKEVKIA